MNHPKLFDHISELASEEVELWERAGDGDGLAPAQLTRRDAIKVELDQCYEFLQQRQARRSASLDSDDAIRRSTKPVEHYQE